MAVERGADAGFRSEPESSRQRSVSDAAQPWRRQLAASAAVLFAVAFTLDLVLGAASWVPLLYVMPIAVVAILFGVLAGLTAGAVSLGLVGLVSVLTDGPRSAAVYAVLAVIFALVGALARFRGIPEDELSRPLKVFKGICGLLLILLLAVTPALAPTASTPNVAQQYQSQMVVRAEDVHAPYAGSDAFLDLLDDLDDDDLSRYREVRETLRAYLNKVDAGSRVATAAAMLADAVQTGELEAVDVLEELREAGALEDPERALRRVSTKLLLVETNETVTKIALAGEAPLAEADLAEVAALVEADLPNSMAAARLRQQPSKVVIEIEHGPEDDPDWMLLMAQAAGEAAFGLAEERTLDYLVGVVTHRRRDRKGVVADFDAVRDHVLKVFGSSEADLVSEEHLESGATRWELVLDDGRRIEARAAADGTVLDACLRSERTVEENRELFDRDARTPDNWVWLDARKGLRDRLEGGERLLGLCGCGQPGSLVPWLVLFTSKRLLWSRRMPFSTTTGEVRWRDVRSIDDLRYDRLLLRTKDDEEVTLTGLSAGGVCLEESDFPFGTFSLRRRLLSLIERSH